MIDAIYGLFLSAVAFVIIMVIVIGIGRGMGWLFGPDR